MITAQNLINRPPMRIIPTVSGKCVSGGKQIINS